MTVFALSILGVIIGISSALLGLGGNIFIIPLMPLIVDIPLKEIIATGIFSVLLTTSLNSFFFFREKLIPLDITLSLVIPTFIFSFLGSKFASHANDSFILIILICIMIFMLVRLNIDLKSLQNVKIGRVGLFAAGTVSGTMAGFTGIGSGVILGPLMLIFNLVEHKKISPTINFMIAIACFSATLNNMQVGESLNYQLGLIHLDLAFMIFIPAAVSSYIGR